jgi:hypothetical protein
MGAIRSPFFEPVTAAPPGALSVVLSTSGRGMAPDARSAGSVEGGAFGALAPGPPQAETMQSADSDASARGKSILRP